MVFNCILVNVRIFILGSTILTCASTATSTQPITVHFFRFLSQSQVLVCCGYLRVMRVVREFFWKLEENMEFKINLNSIDIIKVITYAQLRNKAIWAMCLISSILTNTISVVGLWAMGWPLDKSVSVILSFLIWLFGLFSVGLGCTILSLVANPKWRKGRIGMHDIQLNDKGKIESTEYNRTEIYWPAIRSVSVKSSGIYFLHSGSDAFMIPSKGFSSSAEWVQVVSYFKKGVESN